MLAKPIIGGSDIGRDTLTRRPIFWLAAAAAVIATVVGANFVRSAAESRRYVTLIATASAGHELINATNTIHMIQLDPAFRTCLSRLLISPTGIQKVVLGDERPPVGDGHASSRLVLTNALGQGLAVRLRLRHEASNGPIFDVLSYWKISEAGAPADRIQPIRPETNRASPSAGSR